MNGDPGDRLTRIAVFYDGGYLQAVSDYYRFHHPRHARLSISGIHEFIVDHVAREEKVEPKYCHVVDAHYFRGRFSAQDAIQRGRLAGERAFDDILMRENVVTHYLPIGTRRAGGGKIEKGIDVWLALEAFELTLHKRFSVVVLVACDGDYLPLVRKLNTLGTRVMLLAWDLQYVDEQGFERETRTAQTLIDEVTYPVMMHTIVESRTSKDDRLIDNLFVESDAESPAPPISAPRPAVAAVTAPSIPTATGTVSRLEKPRYFGLIRGPDGRNVLFLGSELRDVTFDDLKVGDTVTYVPTPNPLKPGETKAINVRPSSAPAEAPAPAPPAAAPSTP